jgi:hypothetical protein
MKFCLAILCLLGSVFLLPSYAQQQSRGLDAVLDFPARLVKQLDKKAREADEKIMRQTLRSLRKLEREEQKMRMKLYRKDSMEANRIFHASLTRYREYAAGLESGNMNLNPRKAGEYMPYFDSLKTSLSFLGANEGILNDALKKDASSALQSFNAVQDKLKYVSEIRKYMKQRKGFLHAQLSKYGFRSQLKKIDKEVYYYAEYIKQYKNILNDPGKRQQEALRLLNKIPAFREFMGKHSFLASVFGPGNFSSYAGVPASGIPDMPGLQSRSQVQGMVNNAVSLDAGGGGDMLSSRLADVKKELSGLKNKASSWDENAELPSFKPNEMKTKSFLQKLEFGTNLQFGRANNLLPSTADLGAQVAYRFHQNGSVGLGMSYKLGWGDVRRISFSHQGVGLRSFADYRFKKSFFINGGFEFNHNAAFRNIDELRRFSAWQSSALAGISKKYRINKKIKGNVLLLYDFLHRQHTPNTQPLVFRFGYNF